MAPGRKQGGSCWTCRLRRKKCDSIRPICGSCHDLGITCHSGQAKPSWMDGGVAQRHMTETIKGKIKQNAFLRRERRHLPHGDQNIIFATDTNDTSHEDDVAALVSGTQSPNGDSMGEGRTFAESNASTVSSNSLRPTVLRSSLDPWEGSQSSFTAASSPLTGSLHNSSWPTGSAMPIQMQLGSVMIYLDHVFPFLFPFYQPSLIETGRQWLLGLLCQNDVSFHIAASLSAYFFSLVPQNDGEDMHEDCKVLVRDKLVEQMDLAVKSIQSSVSAISHHGNQSTLLDRVRLMEEITQLLIVEVTVRRDVDWTIHLTPALVLFDEIFKLHGMDNYQPKVATLLSALPSLFPPGTPHHKPLPYTADQSALVFFVSLLLFVDIVASTCLVAPPALQMYHHNLLSSSCPEKCFVRLESVIGCQNWALAAIAGISSLCAWKRDAKKSGDLSVIRLVTLAGPIFGTLDKGLEDLDLEGDFQLTRKGNGRRLEGYYSRHDQSIDGSLIANITRIWAYAAKIYLSVSISGWQPNAADVKSNVVNVLNHLQVIDSPAQLRSLSWPICIAGCLALPDQEHDFRHVIQSIGQLGEFGTASTALGIMEAVWGARDSIDSNTWDIASCLNILGSSALLI